MSAIWFTESSTPTRLPLTPGRRHDVIVVGAGITGLVTALLLVRAGKDVAVLEGRSIGAGTTGATTGKVSLLQGIRGQQIAERHSVDDLRVYLDANRAAQHWLLDYCVSNGIEIQRRTAVTYAQTESETSTVLAEHEVVRRAGLATEYVGSVDTPFPSHGAVRLPDQAQFDPMAVLLALAADVEAHGAPIHESTLVQSVGHDRHGDHVVHTDQGEIRAGTVVLATGTPILDRGGFFARLTPQRSYLAAFRCDEAPRDMFISAGTPTRSLRDARVRGEQLLLVGGNGHVVGRTADTAREADDILEWTRRWFPGAEPVAQWSAQDYTPIGELPFAGPLLPGSRTLLLATGYAKWGLTNGVAAAMALSGRITGDMPDWAHAFTTWRSPAPKAIPAAAAANTAVLRELTGGWLNGLRDGNRTAPPAEGCGRVHRHGLRPVAASTVDGVTHEVSAICPHLYGIVRWNSAEKSWDCPLHGSRFAADGTLLEGPATSSLPKAETPLPLSGERPLR